MDSQEIKKRFLSFFANRGHAIIPSASLVPENDPSVLFTTAGMQPLVPYLLGEKHPAGQRLCNVQKCLRTVDIEAIGDNTHCTFFQMMGNWSLGDYFKAETIAWSYQLLTDPVEGFGLDPKRLYVTVFAGNDDVQRDEESVQLWQKVGVPAKRIYYLDASSNWWSPGADGPCGPCSEMFYDVTPAGLGDLSPAGFTEADRRRQVVEIWNDVFMAYQQQAGRVVGRLAKHNVDTGAGLERVAMVLQQQDNIFATDLFQPIMTAIAKFSTNNDSANNQKVSRIIADHLRSSVFLLADGVSPGNNDRDYVLRRLLRRAIRLADQLTISPENMIAVVKVIIKHYQDAYPDLEQKSSLITETISQEGDKFRQTLQRGLREFDRLMADDKKYSADKIYRLYETYGFPAELSEEIANDRGLEAETAYQEKKAELWEKHRQLSKAGSDQKFKGGLGGTSDQIKRYHTATHLLHQALGQVLGAGVAQRGSNITDDRLRFDFSFERKLTEEEKQQVSDLVNEKIRADLPVNQIILPKSEAVITGAKQLFGEKYGDQVSIYYIGDSLTNCYAKEFCGGPHANRTGELGQFKIIKEEAVARGVRRIKAVLV